MKIRISSCSPLTGLCTRKEKMVRMSDEAACYRNQTGIYAQFTERPSTCLDLQYVGLASRHVRAGQSCAQSHYTSHAMPPETAMFSGRLEDGVCYDPGHSIFQRPSRGYQLPHRSLSNLQRSLSCIACQAVLSVAFYCSMEQWLIVSEPLTNGTGQTTICSKLRRKD